MNANVFPSPTYLAPFIDYPKPEFRELITKDYGEYISVFQLNVQLDHMAISVDEDECYKISQKSKITPKICFERCR